MSNAGARWMFLQHQPGTLYRAGQDFHLALTRLIVVAVYRPIFRPLLRRLLPSPK